MLQNKDIIYFANNWDADNKTSSHQIATLLAKHNRILYVESGGLRTPSKSSHDVKRIFSKIWRFFKGRRKIQMEFKDFQIISLLLIPFHRFALVKFINKLGFSTNCFSIAVPLII